MAYSRGVSLTQIHPSPDADADTDIDIIAIHGLDTKSPDTWISKSCYPDEHVNWLASVPPKPLVNSSSATLDIVTDPLPLNRRHVMMNKFNGPEDPDYQCVVGKIEEILEGIRTNSPLDDADAWIRDKHYAVDRLNIERLSGDLLPMDQCYINLAVVEQSGQDSDRSKAIDAKSSPFSIFNRQKIARYRCPETNSTKTLFLLDGLDEVSQDLASNNSMSRFLSEILEQPNLIITSRPSGRLPPNLDLELEAIGFYPDQVKDYIKNTFTNPKTTEIDEKTVGKIQSFLQDHWLIQGLARIPIQLDALCYSWKDIRSDMPETMTAIYQAIELSLWKKDIVRLEKTHNHGLVTLYHIQNASRQKIEEFVKDEISFLESLAFAGLRNDIIEFEPKHLNFISDRFSGFLLDKTTPSLSFLRTSNPSSEYRYRSYHFIHLTFQEYFAARYFVRQWTARKPLSCVELGSRKINSAEPVQFFQEHKYTARYDILWRFVAGLLDAKSGEVSLFFQKIEEEPLDLLGPAHQRLIMHCLSEVSSNLPIRAYLEQRLSKWLLFECGFVQDHLSFLASEVEFPEQALDTTFQEGSDNIKLKILRSITKRATAPASIIKQAVSWIGHMDSSTREAAIGALQQLTLPDGILCAIAERLEERVWLVRTATIRVLGQKSVLPKEILGAIVARLEDEDWRVREAAAEALGGRLVLPDEILKAVAARLEDEKSSIRQVTARALGQRLSLPSEILKAVVARLEDEDWLVREAAAGALGQRLTLPDEILKAVAARLEDERWFVRNTTVRTLGQRLTLPDEILKAVAARLEDEGWFVRESAVEAFNQLRRLSSHEKTLETIATRLKSKDWVIQQAAFRALNQQYSFSIETIETIVAQLKDSEDSSVRVTTIMALGSQSDLPNEVLKAIAARLKDNDNIYVQLAAIEALGNQLNLPDEILQAIAASLKKNEKERVQEAAITV
ncbi:hypothetical protein ACSS6W_007064 [Trichoderma asperelloides]